MPFRLSSTTYYLPSATEQSGNASYATIKLANLPVRQDIDGGTGNFINGVPLMLHAFEVTSNNASAFPSASTRALRYWKIKIPRHYTDFRDYSGYSNYVLYLPFMGFVNFDP